MFFNSLEFAVFLPVVFACYWLLSKKSINYQNFLILVASYIFYAFWDWKFLSLIVISTLVDYFIGRKLLTVESINLRKTLIFFSVFVNLGILGVFKYYNFFIESFIGAFSLLGYDFSISAINIILPVGISFYTFQTLSYTIDVYKKKIKPTDDLIAFGAFVSFFPQLVAGPIERASNLLPQFSVKRKFDYHQAVSGLKQILWGLFKKIVIADNCAIYANEVFNNSNEMTGSSLVIGSVFFAFQIYGDFSGYSDIAIGLSRLFGFDLKQNFAYPYFSRDIAEFWRRWHISLTTWFRDYLYIPLGGSRGSKIIKIRNTFIVFIVSGLWHGANWTFVIWGLLNALYFLPFLLSNSNRKNIEIVAYNKKMPNIRETFLILFTFSLTVLAWIFFRAENITHAINIIFGIFNQSVFSKPNYSGFSQSVVVMFMICVLLLIEWIGRRDKYAIRQLFFQNHKVRYMFYYLIVVSIILFGGQAQDFIYFQF